MNIKVVSTSANLDFFKHLHIEINNIQ